MTTARRASPLIVASILLLAACAIGPSAPTPAVVPGTGLAITALAGPTCPVERPGDPACAPRPVAGATVTVLDRQGIAVATVVLDAAGTAAVALPGGDYTVRAQPAAGLMGTPGPMDVAVVDGAMTPVALDYDTGIR